ncbi:MAG: DNA polymerase IV [Lachnospiraceae bacterium]
MEKVIFHIDVNSAFLSWDAVERLQDGEAQDLREIPSAVGGDRSKRRGVILAKSGPAKKYKVRTGEPIVDALRKCPDLVIVPPRHDLYRSYSRRFLNILTDYASEIEKYSIDEAYMDVTESLALFGEPVQLAALIQNRIYNELGFTVNVGISSNRLLAKMASDFEKPNRIHTLYPSEIREKMWPLPVRELFLVGQSTQKVLTLLGIHTIGELAGTDIQILRSHLKKQGEVIWAFANGMAADIIGAVPPANKGYGNSVTLPYDVTDPSFAAMILLSLTETVCERLRADEMQGQVVALTIKDSDFKTTSHQMALESPTNLTQEVHMYVLRLFEELYNGAPIRLLGVRMQKVAKGEGERQLNFLDQVDYEKLEKLDKAVDEIRKKFGADAIKRASFLPKKEQK